MFRKHALRSANYQVFDWTTDIWLNSFSIARSPESCEGFLAAVLNGAGWGGFLGGGHLEDVLLKKKKKKKAHWLVTYLYLFSIFIHYAL